MGYIYGLRCPKRDSIKYIGQTIQEMDVRLKGHIYELNRKIRLGKRLNHKENWLKTLKEESLLEFLTIEALEVCEDNNILNRKEIFWIAFYKSTHDLTNISIGGGSMFGFRHSEETKKLLSEKFKGKNGAFYGKKHTDEVKDKLSKERTGIGNSMYGKQVIRTQEDKENRRVAMIKSEKFQTSRKSVEFREKISNIWSIPLLVLDSNLLICEEFKNSKDCAEYFKCTRGNVNNAVRFKRMIGKGKNKKYWIIRKDEYKTNDGKSN